VTVVRQFDRDLSLALDLELAGQEAEAPAVQHHSDSGVRNMERLIEQHHEDVRFLRAVGWHAWDGRRYAPKAEAELTRRAIATVRTMYHEAAGIADEKARTLFLAHIRKSESEPELRRMVTLAQSHALAHVSEAAAFDADPMLFNVQNGTVDLRDGSLRPHRREDMLTKVAGCAFDAEAACPTWLRFLETTFGDDEMIQFVRRLVGYFLTGEVREHILPIFWGSGANGKTTLLRAVLAVLGDYGTTAPSDLLVLRKHKDHPTELMVLLGARLAVASETPLGGYLAETLVKSLTGNDTIAARRVFHDYITFTPTHKLLIGTNHKPQIRGTDDAVWRRVLLIPFTHTVPTDEQDPRLLDKLVAEAPGILAWAVRGCLEWQSEGLRPPEKVRAATDEYRKESDHFPTFLDECCVVQSFAKVEKGAAFITYTKWCEANGEHPVPKREFGYRLKALGADEEKSNGRRFWTGIGLLAKEGTPK
jgi:putative DNA primase/helicase